MRISLMHETHISNVIKPFQTQAIWAICQVQRPSWNDCWTLSNPRSGRMPPPKTCQDLPALFEWWPDEPVRAGSKALTFGLLIGALASRGCLDEDTCEGECYWMLWLLYGCHMAVIWLLYGCCGFCIRILHTYLTYLSYLSYLTSLDVAFFDIFFRVFQSLSGDVPAAERWYACMRTQRVAPFLVTFMAHWCPLPIIAHHCPSLSVTMAMTCYDTSPIPNQALNALVCTLTFHCQSCQAQSKRRRSGCAQLRHQRMCQLPS